METALVPSVPAMAEAAEAMGEGEALLEPGTETATGPAAVVGRTLVVTLTSTVVVQVLWQLLVVRAEIVL